MLRAAAICIFSFTISSPAFAQAAPATKTIWTWGSKLFSTAPKVAPAVRNARKGVGAGVTAKSADDAAAAASSADELSPGAKVALEHGPTAAEYGYDKYQEHKKRTDTLKRFEDRKKVSAHRKVILPPASKPGLKRRDEN